MSAESFDGVANRPASYSKGALFKSLPGDRSS